MAIVKAVKAVTEVTLSLTGEEAALLKELIYSAPWYGDDVVPSAAGRFADTLTDQLDELGVL